jgi:hypothetical protein
VTTWAEWVVERFEHTGLEIEVSQVVIHKGNQPDIGVNLLDADCLAGKDRAEVNLFATETDPAASCYYVVC